MGKQEILQEVNRILWYIENGDHLSKDDIATIKQDTIDNYHDYFNTGYLDFRKSITPDGATIEWVGSGENIIDLEGNKYIDCIGGFGTYIGGHRNPEVVKYVKSQLDRLTLSSTELLEPLRGYLCKAIAMITPGDLQYSYLTNGGAEAVEMALKLAILYNGPGYFISTVGGFHGKSLGAVSMTGKDCYREKYYPNLIQQVQHIEYGNAAALEQTIQNIKAVGNHVTAFIVEPIQGEGGVIIPPKGYLKEAREICTKHGVVMICDEIQTGMGRTGRMWRCEEEGIVPDIMVFGKAVSGGIIPITGIVSRKEVFLGSGLGENPFILGSPTFGGNAIACSAFLGIIKYIVENDIPKMAGEKGKYFLEKLTAMQKKHKILEAVRGAGLMIALEFKTSELGYEVSKEMFARYILVSGTLNNARVVRIEPPAIISYESIDKTITALDEAIGIVENRL
ncbi:aminotransferase class III-fold pyridoxal phosphate-dependent enzyme [Cloacibacillus evryensis]|uniref:aminotransferase class III-fold pyridoxal phosphate-dependent enzyme n=1 Tax=Cloacibacillus evryensis TaxID=508460 RepID=UPI00210B04C7|nr:aminotransferase class III-fold pyridoxal phosphate-dependent enzyme [Cloacibacillus evryensis]MCQ4765138.1 aminotransferase class III-fold pyridoxal phosphate-dependent enzyme [Cloacibacillus evryensis]